MVRHILSECASFTFYCFSLSGLFFNLVLISFLIIRPPIVFCNTFYFINPRCLVIAIQPWRRVIIFYLGNPNHTPIQSFTWTHLSSTGVKWSSEWGSSSPKRNHKSWKSMSWGQWDPRSFKAPISISIFCSVELMYVANGTADPLRGPLPLHTIY